MSHWLFTRKGKTHLQEHYIEMGESTRVIADALFTYPNMVVRALRYHKMPLRTKSEAQLKAMEAGRNKHPTEGSQRSQETRERIGEGVSLSWKRLTPEGRTERSRYAREQWEKTTQEERAEFRKLALEGLRKAAIDGSKTELFLLDELRKLGYDVEPRARLAKIMIDLLLRGGLNIAIFVDGPGHHFPVWGEKKLTQIRKQDEENNEELLGAGYSVVRIMNTARNLSDVQHRNLLKNLLVVLQSSRVGYPLLTVMGA